MWNALFLYGRYLGVSVKAQMQYRLSFLMQSVGHLLGTAIEMVGILALFHRFDSLRGWTLPEVALFYGLVNVAFSFADAFSRGFDLFPGMVKSGDFDRILLRPRSSALQLAGQEVTLKRVGRFAQGFAVLLWAAMALDLSWTAPRILLATAAVIGGAAMFCGMVVLQATLAFWTTESLEIMNTVTYGGVETTQYPLDIYRPWFRKFFTYVVPLAFVNYMPALAILGRPDPFGLPEFLHWGSPLVGICFLKASLLLWRFGERHYTSTGS